VQVAGVLARRVGVSPRAGAALAHRDRRGVFFNRRQHGFVPGAQVVLTQEQRLVRPPPAHHRDMPIDTEFLAFFQQTAMRKHLDDGHDIRATGGEQSQAVDVNQPAPLAGLEQLVLVGLHVSHGVVDDPVGLRAIERCGLAVTAHHRQRQRDVDRDTFAICLVFTVGRRRADRSPDFQHQSTGVGDLLRLVDRIGQRPTSIAREVLSIHTQDHIADLQLAGGRSVAIHQRDQELTRLAAAALPGLSAVAPAVHAQRAKGPVARLVGLAALGQVRDRRFTGQRAEVERHRLDLTLAPACQFQRLTQLARGQRFVGNLILGISSKRHAVDANDQVITANQIGIELRDVGLHHMNGIHTVALLNGLTAQVAIAQRPAHTVTHVIKPVGLGHLEVGRQVQRGGDRLLDPRRCRATAQE
jgi:hypothetical protein